jgi:Ca2+-binding EF-hand superfamily protein
MSSQHAESIFRAFDCDSSGTIEESEFISAMACLGEVITKDYANQVFRTMDSDRDGKVTLPEFLNWYT